MMGRLISESRLDSNLVIGAFFFVRLEYITLIFICVAHNINAVRSSVLFQNAIKPLSAAWCNQ